MLHSLYAWNRIERVIERAILSNAPNSIESPTVAIKTIGKNPFENLKNKAEVSQIDTF